MFKLNSMQEGVIASVTDRGFGFIKVAGMAKDLFFHSNELVDVKFDELRQGDKVKFEIGQSEKGPHALRVTKIA